MASFKIYHKDGSPLTDSNGKKIAAHSLEYNGTWMGECFVSISLKNEAPIDFSIGDYVIYRNERFEINYDPGKIKCSSKDSYGEAFRYESVKFNSLSDELVRCDMLDLVLYDNNLHYTALPQFTFYIESIDDLLDRIQANLDELYGKAAWKLYSRNKERSIQRGGTAEGWDKAYGEGTADNVIDSTSIQISDQNCWEALSLVNSQFDINFIIRNRNVYVGTAGLPTTNIFKYGKDKGLYEIEQNSESDQAIVTRLRAYGSNRNLPNHYYAELGATPFLYVIGDYNDGSTENGLSVLMEDSIYAGMFTNIVYDNGANIKRCKVRGKIDDYEFDGELELVKKDSTKSTTRLLVDVKATSDAVKAKLDLGFTKVAFVSGASKSKFSGDRIDYVSNLPNNMACDRLMLPGFPNKSLSEWWAMQTDEKKAWLNPGGKEHGFSIEKYRPYIDSLNKDIIGIRPASVFFDQDDKTDGIIEIYPTIEEMEVDGVRIDEIYKGTEITDDGRFADGDTVPNADVYLSPKVNFDIRGLMQDDFAIVMKDGMCAGREFKVAGCTKQDDGSWKLSIEREPDDSIKLYFPYNDFQIKKGDHFVLTGIELPDAYVEAASEKLLRYCIAYLDKNDYTRYVFQPKVDEIFMARQHDKAMADTSGLTKSLYMTLKEGDIMLFNDDDLGIDAEITIDQLTIKEEDGKIPTYDITLREEKEVGTIQKIQNQISSIKNGGISVSTGGGGYSTSQIKNIVEAVGSDTFLSKINPDTAAGLITFLQGLIAEGLITVKEGLVIGNFVAGFVGGMGGMIDKDGNAELKSLRLREFLEVPELRNNRIDVVSGELWNSICFGTIERVDEKKRIVWLKLQDGELSGIEAGDICRGVFHCLEGLNPTESKEDECGFLQLAGFATSYFTPTAVYDNGASFKYSLRQGTSVHPQMGMKFAVYGSFTNPARRASAYMTRTYTRYLNKVDTWQVRPDVHIYGQTGDIEGLTISGTVMHGYGAYLHNLYLSGVHVEFDRDWIDHNLPKTYNVVLSTYERTVVTDIEGNPLNGLEELRNVVSGEGNVVSGEENVIATRLALTTTVQATKNGKQMLFSDVMDEGKFLVELNCVGCTAKCENGVVKVTSLDMESVEHRVSISVNCEGEAVYVQEFNVPVVKQGENGVTADLDNEMASIAANDKGEPIIVPFEEIVSNGRMWYGNEEMYLVKAEVEVPGGITVADVTTVTDEEGQHNYLPIVDNKYCVLRITDVDKDAADISMIRVSMTGKIKAELNTEYSKVVVFKLNKVRMGENAQNYSLMVSTPQMQVDGKGNFTTAGVSCSVIGSDGKTLSELTAAELGNSKLTLKAQLYNGVSDYGTEQDYTYKSTLGNGSIIGGKTLSKDSVRLVFLLYWNDLLIDKEGVPIVKNGSSTVRIDLDNENDSMLYNENGVKVSANCTTNVSVYDGGNNVTSQCTLAIEEANGVTASLYGTQCIVSAVSSVSGYVRIRAFYPADNNYYYTIFTVKRLVGEDKYEIVTIPSTVVYDPNTKKYSEQYPDVYVYCTDQEGNRSEVSGSLPYGYAFQYSYNGSNWYAVSNGNVIANVDYPNIYLRVRDNNNIIRDSETIPVVTGGLNGSFKSIVFKRSNTKLSTPSGGTYDNPIPEGWEDGIPAGSEILWSSSCFFTVGGGTPEWTKPRPMTDTATYDVEFSPYDGTPTSDILNNLAAAGTTPSATLDEWFDPVRNADADFTNMIWRAERYCKNGEWSGWVISKIKGEKGDKGADSTSYWFVSQVNAIKRTNTGSLSPSSFEVELKKQTNDKGVESCSDFYLSTWYCTNLSTLNWSRLSSVSSSSKITVSGFTSLAGVVAIAVIATKSSYTSFPATANIISQITIGIVDDGGKGAQGDGIFLLDRGLFTPGQRYYYKKEPSLGENAYIRDKVCAPIGTAYYNFMVKTVSETGVTAAPQSSSGDDNWEVINQEKTVLADTVIGQNCNLGGFVVTAGQFASQTYITNGVGCYINGQQGSIIMAQDSTSQWSVDEGGVMSIGNPSGQKIVIDPKTKDMKVYDANGKIATSISGETVSAISSLFSGSSGSISTVSSSGGSVSGGSRPIFSTNYYLVTYGFTATALSVLTASCSADIYASAFSSSGDATLVANALTVRLVYGTGSSSSSFTKVGTISNAVSVLGEAANDRKTASLSGSVVIPNSGTYRVALECIFAVAAGSSNTASVLSIYPNSISISATQYLSRLLANGFCFGSSSTNFIAALNENNSSMRFNFTAGSTRLEMSTDKFSMESQYGKALPVILHAACIIDGSSASLRCPYCANGGSLSLTRSDTGKYALGYSSNIPLLNNTNSIVTLTPITSSTVIATVGSYGTSRSIPIYLYNINGASQDAYFFIRVEYIG